MESQPQKAHKALVEKSFWFAINALERIFDSEKLISSNQTPYELVLQDGLMSLRHYYPLTENAIRIDREMISVKKARYRIPLVLVPPLAATPSIFDLMPHRSVVRFFLAHGFDVFLIDWGEPTRLDAHLSIKHYVLKWMPLALEKVRAISQQKELSLFSYCMGGLFALTYTAAFQDHDIKNIVTVASPVDFHQIGYAGRLLQMVYRPAHLISKALGISILNFNPAHLQIPGALVSLVFKLTNPLGTLISNWELLLHMWDREYVSQHATMNKWFSEMMDFPGATIQEFMVKIALGNQIARGKMGLGDRKADYTQITSSLLAFAGETDKIVTIPSARKILEVVTSQDKRFHIAPGGHAGVFAGKHACKTTWSISAKWLGQRSM